MGKKIVILFDMAEPPPADRNYASIIDKDLWESELAVQKALQELGHQPIFLGVFNDLQSLISDLNALKPDLVFNMVEAFNNNRDFDAQIAGVLDLLNVPYTGTKTLGLSLCRDKSLSKKILSYHRIRVPKWVTSHVDRPLRGLKRFDYPAFVKPAREEASEGISRDAFVENESDCLSRIRFLHERYNSDVIVEEFIPGRELYVSVLGNKRLQVLPIRELTFREFPEDVPKFATFKAKWDVEYRKKWGIRNEFAKGLSETTTKQIEKMVKRAFEVLSLKSYARFDLRLKEDGEVVLIEANPNPSISPWDDFAHSAQKADIDFKDLIDRLIS